ncbi:MAG: aminoacyl-histidine dipeptidase [Proteobacteria bacterium]|nr:aminoacyl-histidine dipeptidase [Pseudomonadota bacterium]
MSYPVESLEPKLLWKYFNKICQIPHGSKHEKALGEAVISWAHEKGCEAEMDQVGNVVVRIPATKGCENAPTVILQGHLDMVCEKNSDKEFDFTKDPIVILRDGDWIMADGTTLGADNGIGLATGLAFLEMPDAVHGPLELLCTVDEETGLVGAQELKPDFINGRMMFNLDAEEDGVFYVGCAGGSDVELKLPVETTSPPVEQVAYLIQIKGLRGGHSGLDINHNRGNAVRLLARALGALSKKVNFTLASIEGGDKHNAIPREATAVALVPKGDEEAFKLIMESQLAGFKDEFVSEEPEISLVFTPVDTPETVLDKDSRNRVMCLVLGLPHGVLAMVRGMDGMVETSTNMARARIEDGFLNVLNSTRSSIASAIDGVNAQIEAVGLAVGAEIHMDGGYPGWKPNMESKMLAIAKEVWKEVHGGEAEFTVIHAGLECCIIGEKFPEMDMISLGPTIVNPHSPGEKTSVSTVVRFFDFVQAFLVSLANA